VALASGVAFFVTPQFLGLPGLPIFFYANVRYAAVPLVLGLALLPLVPPLRRSRPKRILLAGLLAVLVLTELDPGVWPTGLGLKPFGQPISGVPGGVAIALAGIVVAATLAWPAVPIARAWSVVRSGGRVWLRVGATALVGLVCASGWLVASYYQHHRYRDTPPLRRIYAWAQHIGHARIGIVGLQLQYPLYGANDTNFVQYIGMHAPHAGFGPITACRAWRAAINRGHYGWLVVTSPQFSLAAAPEVGWTSSSREVQPILRDANSQVAIAALYRVRGRLDPESCPRPQPPPASAGFPLLRPAGPRRAAARSA
jgi:hypothetical protein